MRMAAEPSRFNVSACKYPLASTGSCAANSPSINTRAISAREPARSRSKASNDGISLWCRCDLLEMQQNRVVKAARMGLKPMKLEATASVGNRLRNVTLF